MAAERDRLQRTIDELRDQQVSDWLGLLQNSSVVPMSVQRSLSWRITAPIRLASASVHMVRTQGYKTTAATIRQWVGRRVGRR